MSNPLTGIITPAFKALFNNAIDALLEDTALTVPCRIYFGTTKNTACPNCVLDTITRVSSNNYKVGGPSPFNSGSMCPMCGGAGFIPVDTSVTFNMAVLWNAQRSKFINIGLKLNVADSYVQTISKIGTFPSLMKSKEILFDTNIEPYGRYRYQRYGDPTPIGLGDSAYIITFWTRAG